MKCKYEIFQAILLVALFIHLLLGVVVIALIVENSLKTLYDVILGGSWITLLITMTIVNKKLDDKIKEYNMFNLKKQMKK